MSHDPPNLPPNVGPLETRQISNRGDLAGVPFIDQYAGAWALWEPAATLLQRHVENLNLNLHLEQHAPREHSASGLAAGSLSDVEVSRDGIATIELRGTLMKQASSMSGGSSTVQARRQVRAAAADDSVAAILLVIDSPGGTVAGTADLAADIRAANSKKPVFAYIEDIGASAAYWLAAQAERVSAGDSAIVGSIGVFSVVVDYSKKARDEGIEVKVVRFGALKGAGVPGTEITAEQLAKWQRIIDAHGEDFVATVAAGRSLPVATVRELADGDVHKGAAAVKLRLVDAIESFDAAYSQLVAASKRKSISRPRNQAMSKETAGETATAELRTMSSELRSTSASIAELREHCVGASDTFIVEQLEKSATLAQAMKAHVAAMAKQNDALAQERDAAKAEAAKATAAKAKPGNAPIGGVEDEAADVADGTNANGKFTTLVNEKVEAGMKREQAVRAVVRANPQLHAEVIAEANSGHKAT